jgi:hypothetical protein
MTKITGRPPNAVRQEKNIGFFVTRTQYVLIQQKASQARVNISDYMRKMALYGKVMTRWTPEEREYVRKLVGIANEIHELVKTAKEQGIPTAMLYFEKYRGLIDEIIKFMHHDEQNIPNR